MKQAGLRHGLCLGISSAVLVTLLSAYHAQASTLPRRVDEQSKLSSQALVVDDAWAGADIRYEAVSVGPMVYVAYYDAERKLSVVRVDSGKRSVEKKVLDSVFTGWDAHNGITLAYDRNGYLHLAGNMHAEPLVYARTVRPNDFDSLVQTKQMVGNDESSVTYPKFFFNTQGDLLFSYRSGKSGDGVTLVNRFDGRRWSRLLSQPLFAAASKDEPVNAYPTAFTAGPDGYFHVAWVWRKTYQAETNFNVCYARSKDFMHWEDGRRRPLNLPITPTNAETVDTIPTGGGLLNNLRLGFDNAGQPIISYTKYDKEGNSQIYHARRRASGWQIVQATDWKYRWAFSGGGTLATEIYFGGVHQEGGSLVEDVSHKIYGQTRLAIDPSTLAAHSAPSASPSIVRLPETPQDKARATPSPFQPRSANIRPATLGSVLGRVQWRSLPADNNDKPRSCESVGLPVGCSMTSEIEVVVEGGR